MLIPFELFGLAGAKPKINIPQVYMKTFKRTLGVRSSF